MSHHSTTTMPEDDPERDYGNIKWKNDLKTDNWWQCTKNEISETDSLKKKNSKKWLIVLIILTISGLLSYFIDPVERVQAWAMEIAPGSIFLHTWRSPPVTVYTKVFIFNFTNADAFISGLEPKLKVDEIGPFVFTETLENTNIKFNGNDTMTYTPKRSVAFQRHLSVADPKELYVTVPNIAYLGLGSMIANTLMIANWGVSSALNYGLGSRPFLNITADEYLWGYEDPLVGFAHAVRSDWIPFTKLGILDRMYDEGENSITIRLQDNGLDVTDPGYLPKYSIDSWNGSPGLSNWGYDPYDYYYREEPLRPDKTEKCRILKGASEGTLFPRHLDPNVKNYIFRKTFCRHMPIEFQERGSFMPGITGHWYGIGDDVFETPENNPEQFCYCDPETQACVPKGLSDITPCYYNIPAAVSFPHFYNADPKLVEDIEGLSPSKEKHGSHAVLQPDLGSVVEVTTRIQTNLIMRNIKYSSDLAPLANLHIPLFWVELAMDGLPFYMILSLYALLVILPISYFSSLVLGILSAILLCFKFVNYLCTRNRPQHIVIQTIGSPYNTQKIT